MYQHDSNFGLFVPANKGSIIHCEK